MDVKQKRAYGTNPLMKICDFKGIFSEPADYSAKG